jgi:hypothetical protein
MKRTRQSILEDLVNLKGNLDKVQSELSEYPWDVDAPILIISKAGFLEILKRGIDKEITYEAIENWADAIECRDDLGFEDDEMQEIIFELANPSINRKITDELLKEFFNRLSL